ncbi:MAG: hypothetical protein NVSMB18_20880 [Acetobacteraceae bacterium]
MPIHKFRVGDNVSVLPDHSNGNVRPGTYTIVRAMPVTGATCQYRARHSLDAHERVLEEAQLHAQPASSASRAFER